MWPWNSKDDLFYDQNKEFNRVIINQLYQYGIYNNITEFTQSSIPFYDSNLYEFNNKKINKYNTKKYK